MHVKYLLMRTLQFLINLYHNLVEFAKGYFDVCFPDFTLYHNMYYVKKNPILFWISQEEGHNTFKFICLQTRRSP